MAEYFVNPDAGDDSWDGTVPTFVSGTTGPWKTAQEAFNTVTSGSDELRLMNTAVDAYTGGSGCSFTQASGSAASRLQVYGADGAGDRLNGSGVYVIDGAGISPAGDALRFYNSDQYIDLHDIRVQEATRYGVRMWDDFTVRSLTFSRCQFAGSGIHNVYSETIGQAMAFYDCESSGALVAGYGASPGSPGNGVYIIVGGSAYDNGGAGVKTAAGHAHGRCVVHGVRIYGNGSYGIQPYDDAHLIATQNTFDSNGDFGIYGAGAEMLWAVGNSFVGHTNVALQLDATTKLYAMHNHYHDNNAEFGAGSASPESDKIIGDPLWRDPASGDYTPTRGSPLIGAGIGGRAIGAVDPDLELPRRFF